MFNGFKQKKKIYPGEVIDLLETMSVSKELAFDGIPTIYYEMYLHDTNEKVGKCDLRLSIEGDMYYYGHVGYNVSPKYRGNNYAYYACRVLFKIAHDEYDLKELIVTCNPDNEASYKTLKKLGGTLIDVAPIPHYHELYAQGDRYKCVFSYKIELENGKD